MKLEITYQVDVEGGTDKVIYIAQTYVPGVLGFVALVKATSTVSFQMAKEYLHQKLDILAEICKLIPTPDEIDVAFEKPEEANNVANK